MGKLLNFGSAFFDFAIDILSLFFVFINRRLRFLGHYPGAGCEYQKTARHQAQMSNPLVFFR